MAEAGLQAPVTGSCFSPRCAVGQQSPRLVYGHNKCVDEPRVLAATCSSGVAIARTQSQSGDLKIDAGARNHGFLRVPTHHKTSDQTLIVTRF